LFFSIGDCKMHSSKTYASCYLTTGIECLTFTVVFCSVKGISKQTMSTHELALKGIG